MPIDVNAKQTAIELLTVPSKSGRLVLLVCYHVGSESLHNVWAMTCHCICTVATESAESADLDDLPCFKTDMLDNSSVFGLLLSCETTRAFALLHVPWFGSQIQCVQVLGREDRMTAAPDLKLY